MKRKYLIRILINTLIHKNFTADQSKARLAQVNLATKADIDDFVEKTDFDDKLKSLNKKFN